MYLITTCASCAAPLEQTGTGVRVKQCSRCKTRYCSASCQRDHWKKRGGGHKTTCEKIAADGGAEMFYALGKYGKAIEEAFVACEEPPAGVTCCICNSRNSRTDPEDCLVRRCACRGTEGFAHFTCLATRAERAVENKRESREAMWRRWHTCQQCGQQFHGVVRHALGWSCWVTYRMLPEGDELRCRALDELGHGLFAVGRYEDALTAFAGAATCWEAVPKERKNVRQQYVSQSLVAMCCSKLGRCVRSLVSPNSPNTTMSGHELMHDAIDSANCFSRVLRWPQMDGRLESIFSLRYATCLLEDNFVAKAMRHLIVAIPKATRALGEDHAIVIELGWRFAQANYLTHFFGHDNYRNDLIFSIEGHVTMLRRSSRVLGNHHPTTRAIAASLKLCFDEQLGWTLDDDVRKWLYVRRLLDGDFPPDPADFHFLSDYDPNDLTLDMMRQKALLERLNILDSSDD